MTRDDETLQKVTRTLEARAAEPIDVALVLGSGLGGFADTVEHAVAVPYDEVPGLPRSTVPGHAGRFVFGSCSGLRVGVMQGRVHLYEGWEPAEVVLPVRALLGLGAGTLVVTNAAGAVSEAVDAGDLVLLTDHLNMTFRSPLTGPNDPDLGPRFPDMQNAYDPRLRSIARAAAADVGLDGIAEGVYACMPGPSYETPAEVRMLGRLGADLVGMSTVPEVLAARHMGARVLGISCATNRAAGRPGAVLDHADVQAVAARVGDAFVRLLSAFLRRLAQELPS